MGVTQVSNQGTVTTNETPNEPTDDPETVPEDDPTNTAVTAAPVIEASKTDTLFDDADGRTQVLRVEGRDLVVESNGEIQRAPITTLGAAATLVEEVETEGAHGLELAVARARRGFGAGDQ